MRPFTQGYWPWDDRWSAMKGDVWERRCAAIYEAGHAVIASHFGVRDHQARIWAWPNYVNRGGWDGQYWMSSLEETQLSTTQVRVIAVGGGVGKSLWDHRRGKKISVTCLAELLDCHRFNDWRYFDMSRSDWRMAGCRLWEFKTHTLRAMAEAWELLDGPLWPDLCAKSRELILAARPAAPAAAPIVRRRMFAEA